MNELQQLILDFLVPNLTFMVKYTPRPRHHQTAIEPGLRAQRSQHREPEILGQDGAESAGRCAYDSSRPIARYERDELTNGLNEPREGIAGGCA